MNKYSIAQQFIEDCYDRLNKGERPSLKACVYEAFLDFITKHNISETSGVYVTRGDEVRGDDDSLGTVIGHIDGNPNVICVQWSGWKQPSWVHLSGLRTVDGSPVVGYQDFISKRAGDDREHINRLERQLEFVEDQQHGNLCAWMTLMPPNDNEKINQMQQRIKELEAELKSAIHDRDRFRGMFEESYKDPRDGWVRLTDEDIDKIVGRFITLTMRNKVRNILRDHRDGKLESK